jgi:hypothetical protein
MPQALNPLSGYVQACPWRKEGVSMCKPAHGERGGYLCNSIPLFRPYWLFTATGLPQEKRGNVGRPLPVHEPVAAKLDKIAKADNRSRSSLIQKIIAEWVKVSK